MICQVSEDNKANFSKAQEQWSKLQKIRGFCGQVGGWSNGIACILGLWESLNIYQHFMQNIHDQIYFDNQQNLYYDSLSVNLFDSILLMKGRYKHFSRAIKHSSFLRVANCHIKNDRHNHFIEVQKNIWYPAMQEAGMQAGLFSQRNDQNFLVTTLWKDLEEHNHYQTTYLPELKERAGVGEDLESIEGYGVSIVPEWTVSAN